MFDKALAQGGHLTFAVCHERRASRCEGGDFILGPKEVSFATESGQKLFSVVPTDVGMGKTWNLGTAYFRLRIAGKNYNFDFYPFGVTCETKLLVKCPQG